MNYFVKQCSLLVFLAWANGVGASQGHQPLVMYDEVHGFSLDDNFKFHHTGLLECIDFVYKCDIGRYYSNEVLRATLDHEGVSNLGWNLEACQEASVLAVQAQHSLDCRYKLSLLPGITGAAESERDLSTCFAYHESTNTLIMAFCGMDEPLDKENVLDAELMMYPGSEVGDNVLVHHGLFERVHKEFTDYVCPAFEKLYATIPADNQNKLNIVVTGHSLGGGRALLHATLLAEVLHDTDRGIQNQIKVYNLCGLLPGNAEFVRYMEALLGRDNILTQAPALDKGLTLQPGPGGYTGAGVVDFIKRYNNAACPIPGWYAYDYAWDVWGRNRDQRDKSWQERSKRYSLFKPSTWSMAMKDRYKSFTSAPMHYMDAIHEFYIDWFDPAMIGGYGDPAVIEAKLLPQGIYVQESRMGRAERYLGRWIAVTGVAAGLL